MSAGGIQIVETPAYGSESSSRVSRWRESVRLLMTVGSDAVLLETGLGVGLGLRQLAGHALAGRMTLTPAAVTNYGLCLAIWIATLCYERIYTSGLQDVDPHDRLIKALTAGLALMLLFKWALPGSDAPSAGVLLIAYASNLLLFTLVRPLSMHWVNRAVPRGTVLVAGADADGLAAVQVALRKVGYQALPMRMTTPGAEPAPVAVVVYVNAAGEPSAPLADWESRYAEVCLCPIGREVTAMGAMPLNLHGVQLFALRHPLENPLSRACKRLVDVVGAGLGLLLLLPVIAAVALATKLDSPGPVFYRQRRLGYHDRIFGMFKFRSMRPDAEHRLQELLSQDAAAAAEYASTFKLKNDPRVTRIGRVLRRYSLDEIPQLWNVLRGDMSLVGPRPIVPAEVARRGEAHRIIASVRPGMTGLWQVSGRNDVAYASRCGFDVGYIRAWSLWRDMAIMLRTVAALIAPNSY